MPGTIFVDKSTPIVSAWLNPIDRAVFDAIGDGATAPSNPGMVKVNLSLDAVENTSDLNKPISTATQAALDLKADTSYVDAADDLKSDITTTVTKDSSTGAGILPVGTSAQRPGSPANGYIRYNTDLDSYEGYKEGNWLPLGGATGGGTNDFRLTLTSGVPVTTANVSSAGTIYCTPYKGKEIALYNGTDWNIRISNEFSLALSGLTSGKPYDVFCYDNAGTPTLEFLVWTNDTTRATALAYQDGVLVKSGDATRRYLGTFYTTGTTTTEDSASNRYLWNYYNRVVRNLIRKESTASWTYSTTSWRQTNASSSNQLNFVVGVSEDNCSFTAEATCESTGSTESVYTAIGLDSTTTPDSNCIIGTVQFPLGGRRFQFVSSLEVTPASGRHYASWLEYGGGTNTQTWIGVISGAGVSGILGRILS